MPRKATGELRKLATGWEARIRIDATTRRSFLLTACFTEEDAAARKEAMANMAVRLRRAGLTSETIKLLEMAATARAGRSWEFVLSALNSLCTGITEDVTACSSFEDFATEWTSGELHKRYPDHVPAKDSKRDEELLKLYVNPYIGAERIDEISLDDVERVMANVPDGKAPATRRHIAQVMRRVLALAVYPARLRAETPIPRGWLPKARAAQAKECLFPDEEAALLRCRDVPLLRRLAYGVLSREGMRTDELARLRWADVDRERGRIKLDENKTDDPRDWACDTGTLAALRTWFDSKNPEPEPTDYVFAEDGVALNVAHLAHQLRQDLKRAEVKRPELFERSPNRRPIRAHDLRATFVTVSLATGKTETWVADRTGHRSSGMINAYRRKARTWSGMALGELAPLHRAIPEVFASLSSSTRTSFGPGIGPQTPRTGGEIGRRSGFRFRRVKP